MRLRLSAFLAALALLLGAGALRADPVVPGEEHCVVNIPTSDVLNLREGPGTQYRVFTGLRYAQCGIIVTDECRGNWCPAEDGHYAGWAHRHYLSMVSPAMYCVSGVAANDVLNLRAYPSPQSRILARLAPNLCGIAFLPYAVGNWQKVRADGWEGWVNRRYLSGQ
jgi:SH3-like domain-containing protein